MRDNILNLQPTSFTEKETNAATTTNPSPGAGRSTAFVSVESVAQSVPSVKQKYSLGDDTRELDAGYLRAVEKDAAENEPTCGDEGLLPEKKRGGTDYAELATEEIERTANRLLQQGYISSEISTHTPARGASGRSKTITSGELTKSGAGRGIRHCAIRSRSR